MSKITILGDTSGKVELVAANTISPNVSFTLPSADGTSGQVLATNGSGVLSFITNDGSASFQAANSAGAYANAAFVAANTPSTVANAAFATANTLLDGTADASVNSLITPTVQSLQNEGGSFLNLQQNDTRLSNDFGNVQLSVTNQDTSDSFYLTLANTDGSLSVPGNIYANAYDAIVDTLTANTVTSVNVISSNILTANNLTVANNFSVSGVTVQWHEAPLTSKGHTGDKAGFVAIDNDKIYRCIADYTDGNADIWVYVNFTGGTWG